MSTPGASLQEEARPLWCVVAGGSLVALSAAIRHVTGSEQETAAYHPEHDTNGRTAR